MKLTATKKVITKLEILGVLLLFFVIMVVFFPKGKLESFLITENKNYDLSIQYLEDLVKANPDNVDFKFSLLRLYLKSGKLDKVEELLDDILQENFEENDENLKLIYKAYKDLYFYTDNKEFLLEAKRFLFKIKDEAFVEKEGLSLGLPAVRYKILKRKLSALDEKSLKELLSLSLSYKDYTTSLKVLDRLYQKTKKIKYLEKKAEILLARGKVHQAFSIYSSLFENTHKRKYFLKALNVLLWNKKYKDAVSFANKWEDFFLRKKDVYILKKIIKVYLQTGSLSKARSLSKKILRLESYEG